MFESFLQKIDKERFIFYRNRFLVGFLVVILGIYVGNMLFGKSSLEVLSNLKSDKYKLEKRIDNLKKENSNLQKKFFELQQLDPDTRKE
jgi:cell division protein FtsB